MPSKVKRRYRYLVIWGSLTNTTWSIKVNKVPLLTRTSILHDLVLQLSHSWTLCQVSVVVSKNNIQILKPVSIEPAGVEILLSSQAFLLTHWGHV